jgi:hypothetical protein
MTSIYILFTIRLMSGQIETASNFSISDFLLTVQNDIEYQTQMNELSLLQNLEWNTPFFQDVELRLRNDGFEGEDFRVGIRFKPSNFSEQKTSKALSKTYIAHSQKKQDVILAKALLTRYNLVIDYLEKESLIELTEQQIILQEDWIKVLERVIGQSNKYDLNDLIEAENKLTKLTINHLDQQKRFFVLNNQMIEMHPICDFTNFTKEKLVNIDEVEKIISDTLNVNNGNNVYLNYENAKYEIAENDYNYERSLSKKWLNYFELTYNNGEFQDQLNRKNKEKDYSLNQAFIFEVGFNFPGININYNDLNRKKIRLLDAKDSNKALKTELVTQIQKDYNDIKVLLEQYHYLCSREEDVNAEASLKKYLEMEGIDPITLLTIKESILENQKNKIQAQYDILRNYIRLLNNAGVLAQKPLKNFLLENNPEIGINL